MLTSSLETVTNCSAVHAATHSINSSYWNKNRRVKVTKKTTFKRFDALKRRYVKGHRTYKPGRIITVRAAGEFVGWVLAGTRPGSRYWYVSEKKNSNWMKEYHKPKALPKFYKEQWKGKTYTDPDGSKFTFKGLKRITIHNTDPFATEDGKPASKTEIVLLGRFLNNTRKYQSPKHWITGNLFIYPEGTNNDHFLFEKSASRSWASKLSSYKEKANNYDGPLAKNYYNDFCVVLEGDKEDMKANNYVLDDAEGHKITIPIQNETISDFIDTDD